jgi:hypothetical protein
MIWELAMLGLALASDTPEENPDSPYWNDWLWEKRFEHADRIRKSFGVPKMTPRDRMRALVHERPFSRYVVYGLTIWLAEYIPRDITPDAPWVFVQHTRLHEAWISQLCVPRSKGDMSKNMQVLAKQIFLPWFGTGAISLGFVSEEKMRSYCGTLP